MRLQLRAPAIPQGATALGAVSGQTPMRLEVTLRVPDQAALTAFIAGLSDRHSPRFHQFLRPGQFAARFGATTTQISAVESALRAEGLTVGRVSPNRLAIAVSGSAAAVGRAFGTSLVRYRLASGRVAFTGTAAPSVPATAAPYVQGVLGLSDLYLPHSELVRPIATPAGHGPVLARPRLLPAASGPQPCSDATTTSLATGSYTADELAAYYAMPPLYQHGDFGQGVGVALVEFEPNDPADIAAYASCYGVSTSVSFTKVDGFSQTGAGSGEAALDIEDVMGLAPDTAINVYQAPNGGSQNTYDVYNTIITNDTEQVISTSWGLCELDSDPSLISAEDTLFAQAAAQGQTVLAAAGDTGSTDCLRNGTSNAGKLAVDDPASQPYVVSVGGTSIGSTESVWNNSASTDGAGGGGISAAWCMPSYQDKSAIPGLIGSLSKTSSSCGSTVPYIRQVPDVSADADPQTGYVIYVAGMWEAIGGTSAAAPLWAAVAALIDESPFCADYGAGAAGVQAVGLYAMAAAAHSYIYGGLPEGLFDVTSGNNDYKPSGYTGGLFPARTGYDLASGLGSPLMTGFSGPTTASMFYPGLAALMCRTYGTKLNTTSVTRISPVRGPSSRSTTVTVTGIGFLPIAGADMAVIGTKRVAASCTSTTRCTVKLPAMKAGTVNIRISAEDFTLSAANAASRYQFVAAPTIKSLSPTHGARHGGNTITITGTSFIGVTAVHFGSRLGTHVRVVSATKLTVTVPAGSGTVTVDVVAAGGTSKGTKVSRYKYA